MIDLFRDTPRRPLLKTHRPGIPLIPKGSLAYGAEIKGKEITFQGPDLGRLCRDFFDGRKPGFVPKKSATREG